MFSWRWSSDKVPGIGNIVGERLRSHASAICAEVAPYLSSNLPHGATAVPAQRKEGDKDDVLLRAVIDNHLVLALRQIVMVLDGGNRHDPAGSLDLVYRDL